MRNKKRIIGYLMVIMLGVFIVGCSEKSNAEESKDTDKNEVKEDAVPEDEELFTVLKENIKSMEEDDIDRYMETIHPESPAFDSTKDLMEQLSAYTLDIKISDLVVEEKSEEEAKVSFKQKSIKIDGPEYQNNEVIGVHTLKPDGGVWKVFNTEPTEQLALDDDGKVIEEEEADAEMKGKYGAIIKDLEMPFESDKWGLVNYNEAEGEAIAEFIATDSVEDSDLTELLAVHYFEDGEDLIGTERVIQTMEKNLSQTLTGDFKFNTNEISAEEGTFDFSITGDKEELDQEEIGRAFAKDGDLFLVRYTVLEEKMDDKDAWIEKLKQVK